jgi:hypothetical protein
MGNLPIFIEETNDSRTCFFFIVLLIHAAGLRDFACVIVPPYGKYASKPGCLLCMPFVSEPLSTIGGNHPFSLIVWGIFA